MFRLGGRFAKVINSERDLKIIRPLVSAEWICRNQDEALIAVNRDDWLCTGRIAEFSDADVPLGVKESREHRFMLGNRSDTERHLGKQPLPADGLVEFVGECCDFFLVASSGGGQDLCPVT